MEFGKRHDTTDTTDFCPCQLIYGLVTVAQSALVECGWSRWPAALWYRQLKWLCWVSHCGWI